MSADQTPQGEESPSGGSAGVRAGVDVESADGVVVAPPAPRPARQALEAALRDMLNVRFPSWAEYQRAEFADRLTGIFDLYSAPAVDVAELCHWRQDKGGAQTIWSHQSFHFGNECPYAVIAAVLRGEPDPREGIE